MIYQFIIICVNIGTSMHQTGGSEGQKIIRQHYLSNFNGPVLITAPHSKKIMRKGKEFDEPEETHLRQKYAGLIALRLATKSSIKLQEGKKYKSASFMIWGTQKHEGDPDPNYLKQQMLQNSVFHRGIHTWIRENKGLPLFHVDIHGKSDSNKQCVIEVGTKASWRVFKDQSLSKSLNNFFDKQFENAFEDWQFKNKKCVFNSKNPHFKGSWGHGIYTMADQSARLGIPSLQMQIPYEVRQKLAGDDQFLAKFHKCIMKVYKKVIIPYWQKLQPPKINQDYANSIKQTIKTKDFDTVLEEQTQYEIRKSEKYKQSQQKQEKSKEKQKHKKKKTQKD